MGVSRLILGNTLNLIDINWISRIELDLVFKVKLKKEVNFSVNLGSSETKVMETFKVILDFPPEINDIPDKINNFPNQINGFQHQIYTPRSRTAPKIRRRIRISRHILDPEMELIIVIFVIRTSSPRSILSTKIIRYIPSTFAGLV